MPLTDGDTTNIWAISTRTAAWRQVTDFGNRATFIARRVSWSANGRSILAAVGEGDADIVLLDGLLTLARRRAPAALQVAATSFFATPQREQAAGGAAQEPPRCRRDAKY